MAVTSTLGRLGPCQHEIDSTDVGGTKGSVAVTMSFDTEGIMFDQLGTAPADVATVGFESSATSPLGEIDLTHWLYGLPGESIVTDSVDSSKKKIEITGQIGQQALRDSLTGKHVFKPKLSVSTIGDENEWITFPKGYAQVDGSFSIGSARDQRLINLAIQALPDTSNSNVRVILGDETATA